VAVRLTVCEGASCDEHLGPFVGLAVGLYEIPEREVGPLVVEVTGKLDRERRRGPECHLHGRHEGLREDGGDSRRLAAPRPYDLSRRVRNDVAVGLQRNEGT